MQRPNKQIKKREKKGHTKKEKKGQKRQNTDLSTWRNRKFVKDVDI
jgi:hypothetical protein